MNWPRLPDALKNLLIVPGAVLGWMLADEFSKGIQIIDSIAQATIVFPACCLVAAWNYALNDYCDRDGDRWHPEKSGRVCGGGRMAFSKLLAIGVVLLSATVAVVSIGGVGIRVAIMLGLFALSGAVVWFMALILGLLSLGLLALPVDLASSLRGAPSL